LLSLKKLKNPFNRQKRRTSSRFKKLQLGQEPAVIPLDQRMITRGLKIENCKYFDSKKLPLFLAFENEDKLGNPILVIFKSGDDLRQDVLTLQIIRLMDKLWKREGLDLKMNPYGCIATGNEIGFIQVVINSDTTANINKQYGGAKAVMNKDTLTKWIRSNHQTDTEFEKARKMFLLSCAGYCVATYVLGIGDRQNDNIMLTRTGQLFRMNFISYFLIYEDFIFFRY